jgi:hypothetical protein
MSTFVIAVAAAWREFNRSLGKDIDQPFDWMDKIYLSVLGVMFVFVVFMQFMAGK